MAHAYTPGLVVSEYTKIVKERKLPLLGDVKVKVGDSVKANVIVATTNLPGNVRPINIANKLGIEPGEVPGVMIKNAGDNVKKGEVIATNVSFWFFKNNVISPIDGFIENISKVTGQVLLREPPIPVNVNAYIDGKIAEVMENEGVVIESYGTFIQGIFGIGGEVHGEIKVVVENNEQPLTPDLITEDLKDKVIIGGSIVTSDALNKACKVGVAGVVVGGFDDKDLREFLGYDLGVAITGKEDKGTTLILTEGFGNIKMAKKTFDLLKQREGRIASINGATQIRAGVIRPEVIVPEDFDSEKKLSKGFEEIGLEIGSYIRCIRTPYFGDIAKVTALPHKLNVVESETKVRVLEAQLEDGRIVTIPRANVELIEG